MENAIKKKIFQNQFEVIEQKLWWSTTENLKFFHEECQYFNKAANSIFITNLLHLFIAISDRYFFCRIVA